jgi:hypothetical protein
MNTALSCLLGNYFCNSFASIKLIEQIILGLIKVRDVNLTQLALTIEGHGNQASRYRKLQRFFSRVDLSYANLTKLLVKIVGIESEKWLLALDRTNWKFGKLDINILVLSICYEGIAIPIMWDMLAKAGASNNFERQQLMERFIGIFGVDKISALLGDREFIGDLWLKFLADRMVPFYIRIKTNLTIGRSEGELVTANHSVKQLKGGEYIVLKGKRYLGKNYKGPKLSVSALRNTCGELVIIATNENPYEALNIYKRRWEIETLFGCLKTRGFNFENTHMINLDRISRLLGILAITFTFAYVVGIWQHTVKPIKLKQHGRKAISMFRYGLDYLRRIFFNPDKMQAEILEVIEKFIKPIIQDLLKISSC